MTPSALDTDVARFQRLTSMETLLRVLQRTTGLRIALVARVAEEIWTVCAIVDDANFGIKPGNHLELQTTY